ncbi:unnamed protein product [Dicrocoelium dendriticum]|nr:unnamed protein product [Dicrocoelium dendriticum]
MTVYLRIKRLRDDLLVVNSFEAQNLLKRPRTETENAVDLLVFRYIGSQLHGTDPSNVLLNDLCKVDTDGVGRLTLNSTLGPTVSRGGLDKVTCEVQVKTLKRVASNAHSLLEDEKPLPCKMFRVIDIVPHGADDPFSFRPDSIHLNASENKRPSASTELDFVYDFYRLEKHKPSHSSSHSDSEGPGLWFPENEIVFDYADEEGNIDWNVEDEDDSNSESNWRNDYPDEEESHSESDSDPSNRLSSGDSTDEDSFYHYRPSPYCAM